MKSGRILFVANIIIMIAAQISLYSAEKQWVKIDIYSEESGHTVYSRIYNEKGLISQFDTERYMGESDYDIERYTYEYDSGDSLSERIRMRLQGGDVVPYYKSIYEYYENGPRKKYESWYWTGSEYIIMNSAEWKYDEDNYLTESLSSSFDSDTIDQKARIIYEYDDDHHIIMEKKEEWRNDEWVNKYIYSYQYLNGYKIQEYKEKWSSPDVSTIEIKEWEYEDTLLIKQTYRKINNSLEEYTYNYDERNRIVEENYRFAEHYTGELKNVGKIKYDYPEENKCIETQLKFSDGNWIGLTKRHTIKNTYGKIIEYLIERYETGVWIPDYKYIVTFNQMQLELTEFHFIYNDNGWQPFRNVFWEYTSNGNLKSRKIENYDNEELLSTIIYEWIYENNLPVLIEMFSQKENDLPVIKRVIMKYDDGLLTEEIHQEKNGDIWENTQLYFEFRERYLDIYPGYKLQIEWQEITSTDEDDEKENVPFVIYPQPSSGIINLNYIAQSPGAVAVRVIDMSGNVVYTQSKVNTASLYRFDLSGLANGVYIFEINDGGVIRSREIVIAR